MKIPGLSRIRVGGSLGKLGDKAKKFAGKTLSNPWVQGGLGFLTGGATIPLLAGATAGALKERSGLLDIAKGAAKGGAAGYGGSRIRGGLQSLLSSGGSGSGTVTSAGGELAAEAPGASGLTPIAPGAGAPASVLGKGTMIGEKVATPEVLGLSRSPLSTAGNALRRVGRFAEAHPNATAMGLQAVGNLASAGAENRLADAQADALEQRTGESLYDFEQRKRREAELVPLWSALGTTVGNRGGAVAPNPYLPRVA